jgi:hypothetical protein
MRRGGFVQMTLAGMAVATAVAMASPVASASTVPKQLRSEFIAFDTTFAKADTTWTDKISALPASATTAQIAKYSPAYVAAIKVFDSSLTKLKLPGKAGTDAKAIVTWNSNFSVLLDSAGKLSMSSFKSQFSKMFQQSLALQQSFAKDMNIPAADIFF